MADSLIGKQVNNFIIRERIGQGGMATVYLAYQPSVNREVALKIITLNAVPGARDEFRLRFAQEAQVIAGLEHAHILPVYDYGIYDNEIAYIAMRLLRGGTLADLLVDKPLELDRAAEIFSQIALGLSYAHRKGVIHRDLKPSNIMFDELGFAYLSDFGLAKMVENSLGLTKSDAVLGTPTYMSPEQLRGGALDNRTDIYSLGGVLYHMLVGHQPFADSATSLISIIYQQLEKEPTPPHELNPKISLAVEQVVLRALNKDRDARFTTAEEMATALNKALGRELRSHEVEVEKPAVSPSPYTVVDDLITRIPSDSISVPQPRQRSPLPTRWLIPGAVVIVIAVALVALNLGGLRAPEVTGTPSLAPSSIAALANTDIPTLPPSPIANLANTDIPTLPPTETQPAIVTSPVESTQAVAPLDGEGGQIAFVSDRDGNNEIYLMNLDGTGIRNLTNDPAGDEHPSWSPDGSRIVFMSYRDDPGNPVIYIMDADGGNVHRLFNDLSNGYFPAWSPDGTQIAMTFYTPDGNAEVYVVNTDGSSLRQVTNRPGNSGRPTWSPDGKRLAFESQVDGNNEIYVIDVDGTNLANVTNNPAQDYKAAWSPDGKKIVFVSNRDDGNSELYVIDPNGGHLTPLTANPLDGYSPTWSLDGTQLLFSSYRSGESEEIYIMDADGGRIRRLTNSPGNDEDAVWRP